MPFALLGAIVESVRGHWTAAAIFLAVGITNRMVECLVIGWAVLKDKSALLWSWLYPLRDFMGFLFWAASYLSSDVRYRGEMYTLLPEGRIKLKVHARQLESATCD